ncbi:MAG: hypothetical protein WCD12_01135 [Candidatus Binatus sp.]|uniref:hypothetical protein n=1 Tax=Candidatus Binatus sp. TaxID=2811406 RepID=UPI003C768664
MADPNSTTQNGDSRMWLLVGLWGLVFATVFGEGLFAFIEQQWGWGLAYTVVGLAGIAVVDRAARGKRLSTIYPPEHLASATIILVVVLAITWVLLGYDIYDRHRNALSGHLVLLIVVLVLVGLIVALYLGSTGSQIIASTRKTAPLPAVPHAATPTGKPHEVIPFDYLPKSPIDNGWKQGYPSNPVPPDATWKVAIGAPTAGSLFLDLSDTGCAIDFEVSPNASLSTRLVCDANFRDKTAMLWVRVRLVTLNGRDKDWGFIKFDLNEGQPVPDKRYKEWVLPIKPESLGNGWRHLDISLRDAVEKTWGNDGWLLGGLLAIRLRGHLSISPIELR